MNKLASIFYLQSLGLPTIWPRIILGNTEGEVRNQVNSFYYKTSGRVLRCGRMPNMKENIEGMLPWDVANTKEELVKKIMTLQKEIGSSY
ncbi:MAG: hypothetical protein QXP53_02965 [Candidatus Pacearchaeota archaeon]